MHASYMMDGWKEHCNPFINMESTNRLEHWPLDGDALKVCDLVGVLFRCSHCSPMLTDRLRDMLTCKSGDEGRR